MPSKGAGKFPGLRQEYRYRQAAFIKAQENPLHGGNLTGQRMELDKGIRYPHRK